MIRPDDLLELARTLLQGTREVEWRSATSRAYYAALHTARTYCEAAALPLPIGASHERVIEALQQSKLPDHAKLGQQLKRLRGERNLADYEINEPYGQRAARKHLMECERAVAKLDELRARLPAKG